LFTTAHIALSVANINKSVSFYRKIFRLKCREKFHIKSIGLKIAIVGNNKIALELFEFKQHKALPKYRKTLDSDLRTIGTKHVAFGVADIRSVYNRLKRAKVRFATDIRVFENGLKYFFIKDPDGALIEITES